MNTSNEEWKGKRFSIRYNRYEKFIIGCKSAVAIRVLSVLVLNAELGYHNKIYITRDAIAKELGTSVEVVSNACRLLVKKDVISKISNGYMLNPSFVFVGSESEINKIFAIWVRTK